jgi:NAD+ synthase
MRENIDVRGTPYLQDSIARALGVSRTFDPADEIARRIDFLADYLATSGARGYVLGVSGGVDSSTAGRLCQLAVEEARAGGRDAVCVAMRLPYRVQFDDADARHALEFIRPDETLELDVAPPTEAMVDALRAGGARVDGGADADFVRGNIKARQRMVAQYAVANARGLLVLGTGHAAEAVLGFFTKHGDGACDVAALAGLTKRRVRAVATALGADDAIVTKPPTADLESNNPGVPDEDVLGLSYDEIDDFLEGRPVSQDIVEAMVARYQLTAHKRTWPASRSTDTETARRDTDE